MARWYGRRRDAPIKFKDGLDLANLPPPTQTFEDTFTRTWEDTFTRTWEDSSLLDMAALVGPQSFTAYAAPDDPEPVAFKAILELEVSEGDDVSLAIKPATVQDELAIREWLIKMCGPFDKLTLVFPVGKHCTKCGETTMWPDVQALADKLERAGGKIEREIVEVICDKCLQSAN